MFSSKKFNDRDCRTQCRIASSRLDLLKNKMHDINDQLKNINKTIDPLPEMKRELANNSLMLMDKTDTQEFRHLERQV